MSTSTERKNAFDGDTLFIVDTKNGAKIEELSAIAEENEVLFKTNQKFKVKDIQPNENQTIIYMEEN